MSVDACSRQNKGKSVLWQCSSKCKNDPCRCVYACVSHTVSWIRINWVQPGFRNSGSTLCALSVDIHCISCCTQNTCSAQTMCCPWYWLLADGCICPTSDNALVEKSPRISMYFKLVHTSDKSTLPRSNLMEFMTHEQVRKQNLPPTITEPGMLSYRVSTTKPTDLAMTNCSSPYAYLCYFTTMDVNATIPHAAPNNIEL